MTIAMRDNLTPQPIENDTRLPGTPVFIENGNENGHAASCGVANSDVDTATEVATGKRLAMTAGQRSLMGEVVEQRGAGYHETQNRGNHSQVIATPDVAVEIQLLLGQLGVNLAEARVGRKHVFDDFLRGRLVSLLAMGLSLRQAGAALGMSHVAISKELKRNPELTEQVTAARFQAQIEPLLVILRESKRSWRAATWVVNYLQKQIREREETPDESRERRHAEFEEEIVRDEESSLAAEERRRERQQAEWRRQVEVETEALRRERKQRKARKQAKLRPTVGVIGNGGLTASAP